MMAGQLHENVRAAFSFAPPSIPSLTICDGDFAGLYEAGGDKVK